MLRNYNSYVVDDELIKLKQSVKDKNFFHLWKKTDSDLLIRKILGYLDVDYAGEDFYPYVKALDTNYSKGYNSHTPALSFLKKNEDIGGCEDRRKTALDSFLLAERQCQLTNVRLAWLNRGEKIPATIAPANNILWYASQFIGSFIGEVPDLADVDLSFGPGASVTCRTKTSPRYKLSSKPSIAFNTVMSNTLPLPHYINNFDTIDRVHAALECVPKNFKTDRTMLIEPTLNGMVQRHIGSILKRRCLRVGINLSDATINKERARIGSLTNQYATVDLKSASDTVASLLISLLFPLKWVELLDNWRTATYSINGSDGVELHKFSSMGNGFTFELESIVFYALAYGISRFYDIPIDISIFGDDLIIPTPLYPLIEQWFPFFGFSINTEKSYYDGDFRESCGGDFLRGVDVRCFYLKGRISFSKIFSFLNFMQDKPHLYPSNAELSYMLRFLIPDKLLLFGPSGYGDGHLVVEDWIPYAKPFGRARGYEGYVFKTHVAVPLRDDTHSRKIEMCGDHILPLYYSTQITESLNFVVRRSSDRVRIHLRSCDLKTLHNLSNRETDPHILRGEAKRSKKVRIYILK